MIWGVIGGGDVLSGEGKTVTESLFLNVGRAGRWLQGEDLGLSDYQLHIITGRVASSVRTLTVPCGRGRHGKLSIPGSKQAERMAVIPPWMDHRVS